MWHVLCHIKATKHSRLQQTRACGRVGPRRHGPRASRNLREQRKGRSLGAAKRQRDREAWPPAPPHLHTPHDGLLTRTRLAGLNWLFYLPLFRLMNFFEMNDLSSRTRSNKDSITQKMDFRFVNDAWKYSAKRGISVPMCSKKTTNKVWVCCCNPSTDWLIEVTGVTNSYLLNQSIDRGSVGTNPGLRSIDRLIDWLIEVTVRDASAWLEQMIAWLLDWSVVSARFSSRFPMADFASVRESEWRIIFCDF